MGTVGASDVMDPKWLTVALAPIIGPILWWILFRPGKWIHDWLWRRVPNGRLRQLLFRKVS